MKLKDKFILLVSPEPWSHLQVSKHHYALEFARRGNNVFFLNPPSDKYEISKSGYSNLMVIDYKGFWKGLRYFPKFLRKINHRMVFRNLERLSKTSFDIIWSFDNSVFFDFDSLPGKLLKVSHIVDINQDFNSKLASSTSDVCFGVIPIIVDRHKKYNLRSYLIRHGVHIPKRYPQVELPGQQDKKVLYFGNLGMPHLNWPLLKKAIESFSAVDFILLGSNHERVNVPKHPNLHLLNSVESDLLHGYMQAADVLILFYTSEYLTAFASPHKMLEYMSSGKPIVSNLFEEYDNLSEFIYLSDSEVHWLENLKVALSESDLTISDQRIKYAHDRTYKNQIDRIEKVLSSNE